jgi:hypothetical protein
LASLGCFPEPKTAWELALKYNDLSQDTPGFQRSHGIAAVAAGWAQDHAWPLLWGWPRP